MTEIKEFGPSRQIPRGHPPTRNRAALGTPWLLALALTPLLLLPPAAAWAVQDRPPWLLMWVLSSALWLGLKWGTLIDAWRVGLRPSFRRSLGYMVAWPSTDALAFLNAKESAPGPITRDWARALLNICLGLALLYVGVRYTYPASGPLAGWVGMIGLVLVLHFGLFQLLALGWRRAGIKAAPLMQCPIRSASLADFWARRWNTAFSGPARRYMHRPLAPRIGAAAATLAVFIVSGLLHEAVISVPARGGYGLPTTYFLFQALALSFEGSRIGRRLGLGRGFRGRAFAFVVTAGPAVLLFHPQFIQQVILPFLAVIGVIERGIL